MADLALDDDGDILIEDGNMSIVRDADALRQDLQIRLQFFKGEWFLDVRIGIPYFQEILIKNPSSAAVRGIFRRVILQTPGVASLDRFEFDFNKTTRKLLLDFQVTNDDGEIVLFEQDLPV